MMEKDFLDMVVQERIKLLLQRKTTPEEDMILENGEAAIQGLEEDKRAQVEKFINLLDDLSADREEQVYMGGLYDGVRLVTRILKIGKVFL